MLSSVSVLLHLNVALLWPATTRAQEGSPENCDEGTEQRGLGEATLEKHNNPINLLYSTCSSRYCWETSITTVLLD